jgi:hypothetical protein
MSGQEDDDHRRRPLNTPQAAIDEAMAGLADLDDRPVREHAERLAAAHEVLHRTLHGRPVSGS